MLYIFLIGQSDFTVKSIESIEHYGSTRSYYVDYFDEPRFCVEFGNGHIFYDQVNDVVDEYEFDPYQYMPSTFTNFIMMTYTRYSLLKRTLCQDNFVRNIYVDDNFDTIFAIEDFINLLNEDKIDYLGNINN